MFSQGSKSNIGNNVILKDPMGIKMHPGNIDL